jgi:hypothetical protein
MPGLVPRAIYMGLVVYKSDIRVGFPQRTFGVILSQSFRQCSPSSRFIRLAPTPYDISNLQRHYVELLQNDTQIRSLSFFQSLPMHYYRIILSFQVIAWATNSALLNRQFIYVMVILYSHQNALHLTRRCGVSCNHVLKSQNISQETLCTDWHTFHGFPFSLQASAVVVPTIVCVHLQIILNSYCTNQVLVDGL